MPSSIGLIIILAALILVSLLFHDAGSVDSRGSHLAWNIFLFGIPVLLAGLILRKARWALMAAVMYGTIGLALDIATVVQELTKADGQLTVLLTSSLTGLLNFFLIAIGGRGFLDVLHPMSPPAAHAPNPRFPFSKE